MKNVVVRKTDNKGKEVFALKEFKKDVIIMHVTGRIIETEKPSSYSKTVQNHWFPLEKKGKKYIDIFIQNLLGCILIIHVNLMQESEII